MFYIDLLQWSKSNELDADEMLPPLKTPLEDKLGYEEECEITAAKLPPQKKIGYNNRLQRNKARAELTAKIYYKLKRTLPHMSTHRKNQARRYISNLRPSMRALKQYYLKKGDSPEIVNLLVTPENYPELPSVWITRKQQRFLFDILDGKEASHINFINNGFH